ncbi:unnamed protein product [Caenorhabditis brenneri]
MVIRSMGPVQMYETSLCSKNMKATVKNSINNIEFHLGLSAEECFDFNILNKENKYLAKFCVAEMAKKTKCDSLTTKREESTLETSWKDMEQGLDYFYYELNQLFGFSEKTIKVEVENCDLMAVMNWLNSPHISFDVCIFKPEDYVDYREFGIVVNNIPNIPAIHLYISPRNAFIRRLKSLDGKRLFLANGKWVRLENLIKTDFLGVHFLNVHLDIPNVWDEILEDLRFAEDGDAMVYRNSTLTADFSRVITKTYELYFTRGILEGEEVITELELCIRKKDEVLKPVRLLKLPLIVMEHVIRSMDVMETFIMSTCSRRMRAHVKYSIKRRHYKCTVKIAQTYMFGIDTVFDEDSAAALFFFRDIKKQDEEDGKRIELTIGSHENVASYVWHYKYITTYWTDIHFGATKLYLDLMDLFNFTVEFVEVCEKWQVLMDYETGIDWVHNNVETKIGMSKYCGKTVEDSVFSKILNGLKSNKCILYLKPSENYRNVDFKFTKDTPHWKIHEGHWLTLDNFLNMQCATLIIDHCALSDGELHILLLNLIHGSFPNLEYLSITVYRNIDMDVLFEGIDHEETEEVRVFEIITVDRKAATFQVQITINEFWTKTFDHRMDHNLIAILKVYGDFSFESTKVLDIPNEASTEEEEKLSMDAHEAEKDD